MKMRDSIDDGFKERPCETNCLFVRHCRQHRLACSRFQSFVAFGGRKWRAETETLPTVEIYSKIYRGSLYAVPEAA
jgi:hypothetical protein